MLPLTAKNQNIVLWCAIGLVYISNLFVPVFEIDAAQYAEMSRELCQSENWLHFYDGGLEYLDKPPFLFWVSAASLKLFGISVWAYKLPSLLFAIWSIYALYKFTRVFYIAEIATKAAFIFASCQAMFLITNDIKTDTILMSFAITAFWQISIWLYNKNKYSWIWGAVCIAGAMLTKGPIGLLVIIFGFLPHFIIKKEWINLWRWQFVPMLLIIGLFLLPMSYGLYTQFDLHPEKLVNGKTGVSGLHFYYWTQSFGRITGESVWNNNVGFFFLYQNLLWGLIPFTLFFVAATIQGLVKLLRRAKQTEWISTSAVIITYLSLGISKFQLPHYIYVVLPFICLLTARYFWSIKHFFGHKFRILRIIQIVLLLVLLISLPIAIIYVFPSMTAWQLSFVLILSVLSLSFFYFERRKKITLLVLTISSAVIINIMLTFIFYPNLITFQSSYAIPQEIKKMNIHPQDIAIYKMELGRSADFLLNYNIPNIATVNEIERYGYLITNKVGASLLTKNGIKYEKTYNGEAFPISRLTLQFLNPTTRRLATTPYFILKILPY